MILFSLLLASAVSFQNDLAYCTSSIMWAFLTILKGYPLKSFCQRQTELAWCKNEALSSAHHFWWVSFEVCPLNLVRDNARGWLSSPPNQHRALSICFKLEMLLWQWRGAFYFCGSWGILVRSILFYLQWLPSFLCCIRLQCNPSLHRKTYLCPFPPPCSSMVMQSYPIHPLIFVITHDRCTLGIL